MAAGKRGAGGVVRVIRLFGSVPWSGGIRCGQCRWLQSSLRVSRPWPGALGGPRQNRRSGGVNQAGARAAGGRRGRQISDLAPGRWPGGLVTVWADGMDPRRLTGGREAADLAIPHAVEHQGEQPPGGGDFGGRGLARSARPMAPGSPLLLLARLAAGELAELSEVDLRAGTGSSSWAAATRPR